MLNDLLLAFFFGMPAIAAVANSFDMTSRPARLIMFWGGLIYSGLATLVLLPMILCDGTLLTAYSSCFGGEGLARTLTDLQPLIRTAAFVYVLTGPPLAILAYLLDLWARRTVGT